MCSLSDEIPYLTACYKYLVPNDNHTGIKIEVENIN